jgi:hypothetical protein
MAILPGYGRRGAARVDVVLHDNEDAESRYQVAAPRPDVIDHGGVRYRRVGTVYEPEGVVPNGEDPTRRPGRHRDDE